MKPPTQPLMRKPRQGTMTTQKATERILRTTSYPSPKESSEAGHAVQLQLAAHAAFGKAEGKGKGESKKGKRKGTGKVVRSHLTLEQRREKLKSLKDKSKCMRCGALGHWAGDPECKFPTSQGGGKGKAHLAVIADEGFTAGNDCVAAFVARAKSSAAAPKPIAAPAREPRKWSWKEVIRSSTWVSIGMKPTLKLPRR